jgi:predicted alpha/beta-hydrolase family hydrolase
MIRVLVLAVCLGGIATMAQAAEIAVSIPTRSGVSETFAFDAPAQPRAAVILFPGGEGVIRVESRDGQTVINQTGNFLVRTRRMYLAAGIATLTLDVPSDHPNGIDDQFRMGAENAADVAALVAWLRQRVKAPIWLVGTSMGSISAANAAAALGAAIDGLVLTSSVSASAPRLHGSGVLSLPLESIAVPALVMDHVQDGCRASPPGNAAVIAKRLTRSPRTEVKLIAGGAPPRSDPCQAFSYHGYYGAEDEAVTAIVDFIEGK